MKVQTAGRLLLFELLTTTLIYVCKWTPYPFLYKVTPKGTPIYFQPRIVIISLHNQSDVMIVRTPHTLHSRIIERQVVPCARLV